MKIEKPDSTEISRNQAVLSETSSLTASMISARLDRLPVTATMWKFVVLLSFGFFFELYDLLYSGYVVPGLVKSGIFKSSTPGLFDMNGVASFIACLFAGLFVGTMCCGFLADRFGRRSIFTYSLLFYTAANLIIAFQTTATGVNLWRFVAGLGIGVETVTIGAYVSELVPKQIRGRAFAFQQAVGFLSVPVVAFLSYFLVPRNPFGIEGWRWVVLIGAHGALFVWFIRRALPESPRWLAQKGRALEADQVMSALESRVAKEHGAPLPVPGESETIVTNGSFREMWRRPYGKRATMMIIFNLFQTVGFYGFMNWVPTLIAKQGINVTRSLLYSSIIAIAAPIGPAIGLFIADKFERRSVIVTAAGAIVLFGLAFSQLSSATLLIAMGVALTLANNVLSYSYHAYQAELFPTSIRARSVGFVYSWSRFSAIFSSFFIAGILNQFGTVGVFVLIASAMLIAMLAVGMMGPPTRNLALEKISH